MRVEYSSHSHATSHHSQNHQAQTSSSDPQARTTNKKNHGSGLTNEDMGTIAPTQSSLQTYLSKKQAFEMVALGIKTGRG